ncbi:MAG: NUDIX hydrolase [Candidatus Micrarchaeota archaeon]|nr:NUDIX hydrolase [Candidatus Micrarchaeota archaeon]MDE1848155.1 NUDIX hydrolase [Candidatus Micrarchaeota archaeon]MDE1864115.1 NUDIX hydrolase [Candidatus Micrarchaeota archaeon]
MINIVYVYRSKKFLIERKKVTLPNGKKMTMEVLLKKPGVSILPIMEDGRIILIRQYRAYVNKWIYEMPGGSIEKGETPRQAALRELEEETGYKATKIRFMLKAYTTPYFSTDSPYVFVASGLRRAKASREEDEMISIKVLSIKQALRMIKKQKIEDLGTVTAILMYSHISKGLI